MQTHMSEFNRLVRETKGLQVPTHLPTRLPPATGTTGTNWDCRRQSRTFRSKNLPKLIFTLSLSLGLQSTEKSSRLACWEGYNPRPQPYPLPPPLNRFRFSVFFISLTKTIKGGNCQGPIRCQLTFLLNWESC